MNNRELKFRAWDSENKEMLYEPQVFDEGGFITNHGLLREEYRNGPKFWVQSEAELEIMQYTELKGSYEGDVFGVDSVQHGMQAIGHVAFDTDLAAFVIVKTNGGWQFLNEFLDDNKTAKIIGDIYSNPELLNP